MSELDNSEYKNASEEGKIRYFFNWLSGFLKLDCSSEQLETVVKSTIEEWERVKTSNPLISIDLFIQNVSQLVALMLLEEVVASSPPQPSFMNN